MDYHLLGNIITIESYNGRQRIEIGSDEKGKIDMCGILMA